MTEERSRRASDGRQWCSVHLATVAPQRCDRCGRPFCPACLQHVRRSLLCAHCLAELQRARRLRSLPSRLRRGPDATVADVPAGNGVACLGPHGGFTLYGNDVLAATGDHVIIDLNQAGAILQGWDTRLNVHLMEFTLDPASGRL